VTTPELFARLTAIATDLRAPEIAEHVQALAGRAADGRYYVACVGQFKRGKSTLLDALIGEPLLPIGVVPVTAVPTVLRFGPVRQARVRTERDDWRWIPPGTLDEYVSEAHNPGNVKRVTAVEAFVPAPLLATGMCLVDTPGLGSVIQENTEATREFLPHIDAALVVVGTDPPISGDELQLAHDIAKQTDHVVFVVNKADRVTDAERREAMEFAQRVIRQRLGRDPGRLFVVSALERLSGSGPSRDFDALVRHLDALARESGHALVDAAVRRGVLRLSTRLAQAAREEIDALRRPIAETEERIRRLAGIGQLARRVLADLGPLLSAEEQALVREFTVRRAEFLKRVSPVAEAALAKGIDAIPPHERRPIRRVAFELAQSVAAEHIAPWLAESERAAEAAYHRLTSRFTSAARTVLDRLKGFERASVPDLEDLAVSVADETGFRVGRHFRYEEFHRIAAPVGLIPAWWRVADTLGPRALTVARVQRAARDFLERLLETNASRVEHDLADRVRESRRRFEADLRRAVAEGERTTARALERASAAHASGTQAVQAELTRLGEVVERIKALGESNDLLAIDAAER
jgi:hypothetical protein